MARTIRRAATASIAFFALRTTIAAAASESPKADSAPPALPASQEVVRDSHPQFRLSWLIFQAIPSPGMAFGERGVHGTMTWQVTPFLYSWALDKRLSPVRFFVVEPLVRQAGSVELFLSPEYLGRGIAPEYDWGFRAGARVYFPITERGDGLSWSLGASAVWFLDQPGASFDAGIYTLFGGLGLLVSVSPWLSDNWVQTSLRVRYF